MILLRGGNNYIKVYLRRFQGKTYHKLHPTHVTVSPKRSIVGVRAILYRYFKHLFSFLVLTLHFVSLINYMTTAQKSCTLFGNTTNTPK